ncbi:unnamed protein product [Caenorhabditis brenneri]
MANASTSQGNDWRILASINLNTTRDNPVTCTKFDPHEEILWLGTATGRVSGLLPSNHFSRYTAFLASQISPVHSLELTESVVFALTNTSLRAISKQGIPIAKYTSPSMTNLATMCRMPGSSTFLMGGYQNKLIQYDYMKEKEIRTTDLKDETAIHIRYNGSNIFTADSKGKIHVRNSKNCETVQTLDAHIGGVLDFDVQGTKMVTCGSSNSHPINTDMFVKVFDLRMYKALQPIPLIVNPRFVRFMPSYCERLCIALQQGCPQNQNSPYNLYQAGIRMFDMSSNANIVEFPIETSVITAFDFSSNKNYISVGNHSGMINVFADRDHPSVNDNSKETIFAAPSVLPPLSFAIDDTSQSFGLVPIPFSPEPLSSDWPIECTQIAYRRRKPPIEQKNAKSIHYASQVTNPRVNTKLRKHNIVPYFLEQEVIELPSEQPVPEELPQVIQKIKVSKLYKKRPPPVSQVLNRRNNFVDDTLETYTWNIIRHVTMQSTYAMNLVANSVVQVVYSISSLRNIVLRHICTKDSCITCELHFLFTAFSSKIGQSNGIMTTNLGWALARNGVSLKTGGVLSAINQVIKKVMDDIEEKDNTSSISSKFDRHLCCVRCRGLQTVEQATEHLPTLKYGNILQASLCQLIEKSLHLGPESGERECEDCKQMSRMECKRKIRELSPVLLINTNTSDVGFLDFWRRQLSVSERRPNRNLSMGNVPESPSEKKICRYGIDCRNQKTCKYKHGRIDWAAEQMKLLEESELPEWSHYIPSRIAAQLCEGIVRISDISDVPGYDEPNAIVYELEAMVHVIGNGDPNMNWTHPVTLLKESPVVSTAWTMVNEQLVSRLHDNEARHVDARWKLPALLAYKKKGLEVTMNGQDIPNDLFFAEENFASNETVSTAIKSLDELPKAGDLVGLDAEFIKIKTDMLEFNGRTTTMRAVGRASAVDAAGEKIIFDDHVQLNDDIEVVDYLTKFSGIVESDLRPAKSNKYLTSHKRLLLRMHVMIQRGAVFVGHALHNDFTVLNVHVVEPQIIDTVVLMRLETQRMLSLSFLVKEFLGEIIQTAEHDSVIDAKYALKLYRRYMEISEKGTLAAEMRRIYTILPCNSPNHSASPLVVSTISKTPDGTTEAAPKSI